MELILLVFFDPGLNCKKPGLIELLRFNEHLDPLLLLSLEILDDSLVIDEVPLIL